jgi:hypothetical protein
MKFWYECNNFSKIEETWWWSYTAETCSEEEEWLDNKLHLRRKYMWSKWRINAPGCLNTILGKESIGCIRSSVTIQNYVLIFFRKNLTRIPTLKLMRNSFPSQIYFDLPSKVCVAFVIHTRLLLNKISSFINLSCLLKEASESEKHVRTAWH